MKITGPTLWLVHIEVFFGESIQRGIEKAQGSPPVISGGRPRNSNVINPEVYITKTVSKLRQ